VIEAIRRTDRLQYRNFMNLGGSDGGEAMVDRIWRKEKPHISLYYEL
jgi:hypothetical protein